MTNYDHWISMNPGAAKYAVFNQFGKFMQDSVDGGLLARTRAIPNVGGVDNSISNFINENYPQCNIFPYQISVNGCIIFRYGVQLEKTKDGNETC